MIRLLHAPECPYCVRTRLVLAEKDVAYDELVIDLSDRDAELARLNPRNIVPVLVHDDLVVRESAVIDEYLEEAFPEPPLLPAGARARARVRLAIDDFTDLSEPYYRLRRARRAGDATVEAAARPDLERAADLLEARLGRAPYLAGEGHTLADPSWWPWVVRLPGLGVALDGRPAVAAWCERLAARPAYVAELALLA
jgi:glutathione S-transferase